MRLYFAVDEPTMVNLHGKVSRKSVKSLSCLWLGRMDDPLLKWQCIPPVAVARSQNVRDASPLVA